MREGSVVVSHIALQAVTPWFDVENHIEIDRSKSIQMCVVCNEESRVCKCGDLQVLVNPDAAKDHLMALDHELFHHMTGTECGEDE
jgi:hypothetical protein